MQRVEQYGGHRMSKAVGISVLSLPVDAKVMARGFYTTYDRRHLTPASRQGNVNMPSKKPDQPQDNKVVLEALKRLIQGKSDNAKPFSDFGESRPVR
jgi:hypothetical protein